MFIIIYKRLDKWMLKRMYLKLYKILVQAMIKFGTDARTLGDRRQINGSGGRKKDNIPTGGYTSSLSSSSSSSLAKQPFLIHSFP
jgi:hypothetical protein